MEKNGEMVVVVLGQNTWDGDRIGLLEAEKDGKIPGPRRKRREEMGLKEWVHKRKGKEKIVKGEEDEVSCGREKRKGTVWRQATGVVSRHHCPEGKVTSIPVVHLHPALLSVG
jgi:hypothetical protein